MLAEAILQAVSSITNLGQSFVQAGAQKFGLIKRSEQSTIDYYRSKESNSNKQLNNAYILMYIIIFLLVIGLIINKRK